MILSSTDVTSEKAIKKWGHTSTPEYLERRHRYRRSEIKERSKNRLAKEALESSSSLNISEESTTTTAICKDALEMCCADGKDCNCAIVKKELKEGMTKKFSALEEAASSAMKSETPINKYTTNAMPKRIINLKKTRSKTVPSSIFYRTLGDISSGQDLSDSPSGATGTSIADSQEQLLPRSVSRDDESAGAGEKTLAGSRISSSSSGSKKTTERMVRGTSTLRASDSHLNYSKGATKIEGGSPAILTRSNTISNTEQIGSSSKVKKHHSSLYKSWRSVKEEESALSYQHLPGSSDLGERIANNVDYVDPQRLFCVQASNRRSEALLLKTISTSGPRERDSVVSFTSSSDSVDESRSRQQKQQHPDNLSSFGDDSYYEDDIERCLEDASMFRDSAIYSDDNDPRRITSTSSGLETPPPPVPYKPKHVAEMQQRRLRELALKRKVTNAAAKEEQPAPN